MQIDILSQSNQCLQLYIGLQSVMLFDERCSSACLALVDEVQEVTRSTATWFSSCHLPLEPNQAANFPLNSFFFSTLGLNEFGVAEYSQAQDFS